MALPSLSARDSALTSPPSRSPSASPLIVRVTLNWLVLGPLAVLLLVGLVLLTFFFERGFSLRQLDTTTRPANEIEQLIDTYNAYSGTVSSAIQRPVELVLACLLQVIMLRLLAPQLLRAWPSTVGTMVVIAVSALLAFLLNNSLAALNVQQRELPVQSVIVASDLSLAPAGVLIDRNATSVTKSFSEDSPRNPITNTVFRSLLLPRELDPPEECNARGMPGFDYARDTVDYGFIKRDWMSEMLTDAVEAKTFTVVVNASAKMTQKYPPQTPQELPMNASLAADLFLTSVFWSVPYILWGKMKSWSRRDDGSLLTATPAAIVAGLLPSNEQATEAEKRAWFVNQTTTFFDRWPLESFNMSTKDIVMHFSHVNITDHIVFDALTLEVSVDQRSVPNTKIRNSTMSTTTAECRDYPYPELCIFEKAPFELPMQIHAYAWCAGADGSDRLWSSPSKTPIDFNIACGETSKTAMLVVGSGKRLSADAMNNLNRTATATNLRKTYSVTFGRLSWRYTSLAKTYGAKCKAEPSADCEALEYNLAGGAKRLVVGPRGLPMKRLRPLNFTEWDGFEPLPVELVRVYEPNAEFDASGDVLLPHNVESLTHTTNDKGCTYITRVLRLRVVLNNHMYIEHPLQSTYTAAMFLLFQDAVTRDVLPLASGLETLAFDGNIQLIDVWVSVPWKSALISYAGCALLFAALVLAILGPLWFSSDPLSEITDPQTIARVLLDDKTFPSYALHRDVVTTNKDETCERDVADKFEIQSLDLRHRDADAKVAADA